MKRWLGLATLLLATPVAAQQVTIDYAKKFDFKAVKTFQYVDSKEDHSANPMMADRIVEALKAKLEAGGLKEVQENPDIFVTYHLTTQEQKQFNTMGFGYGGYGMGWGAWGGGAINTTTYETTYTEGTIIVDAYEPTEKKMVWRGTGTVTVKEKPEKRIEQIDKIFDKLGEKWQKMLKNQGE